MVKEGTPVSIPDKVLMGKIYVIRGLNVMLDRDLAALYEVETKRLKENVRRNKDRFPKDFMFGRTEEEGVNTRNIHLLHKLNMAY